MEYGEIRNELNLLFCRYVPTISTLYSKVPIAIWISNQMVQDGYYL
jgi:hypothetical protein